jgi:uncharacterized protein YbbC (DUF1343 family)
MRGDKQDNMIESPDFVDPVHNIPVFSLYGEVRRPTADMLDTFDVLFFDVQDVGCRIYTYITTLLYLLEACAESGKTLCVLDRPNPAGRPVEGTILEPGWESFVGASEIIMRHGLTVGEIGAWFIKHHKLDVDYQVVTMDGYELEQGPGYGWPLHELSWVNPSPNAASLNMARCFAGTVLIEGTELSEGRGTTIPLEMIGAPDIDIPAIIEKMHAFAPEWMKGVLLRPIHFEPTFHKHQGTMCNGVQFHTDNPTYDHHAFKPFRLTVLFLKALRLLYPDYAIWRQHAYEYEFDKLPIDLINGGEFVRLWIDDNQSVADDLEQRLVHDETRWADSVREFYLY